MVAATQKLLAIKEVVNDNFTFSDLSPRFIGVDSSTGNIFCPFHENHDTPAAKMYWDSYRNIWVLHCFGECHRSYTAYDYVALVLCEKRQRYSSPLDFLRKHIPQKELEAQLKFYETTFVADSQVSYQKKMEYINSTLDNSGSTEDFIENLYTS